MTEGSQDGGRIRPGIDDAAAVEVTERKETELEGGHDPEVALAAAHQCKQLGLGVGVDPPQRAVGRDNLHAADMVRREAVGAAEHGQPAAERVADDADVGAGAVQSDEPVRHAGLQEGAPLHPGADACGAFIRIDLQVLQPARVDEQAAIDRRFGAVPGGLDGHGKPALGRPFNRGHDVPGICGPQNDVGPVHCCDVEGERLLREFGAVRQRDRAADSAGQSIDVVVDKHEELLKSRLPRAGRGRGRTRPECPQRTLQSAAGPADGMRTSLGIRPDAA